LSGAWKASTKKSLALFVACASLLTVFGGTDSSAAPSRSSPALDAFGSAWTEVTAYSATTTTFEQEGVNVQNLVFKYTFRKPSIVTVDIIGGPNNGVSLLWMGGTTLSAHKGSGFLGMFKRTFALHDPLITTIRGSSIEEVSFAQILALVQETPGVVTQAAGPVINNEATDAVTLTPTHPASIAGYTREVVAISRVTHFPMRVLAYQGAALVRKVDFADVKLTN
jgi:hypothetical protein